MDNHSALPYSWRLFVLVGIVMTAASAYYAGTSETDRKVYIVYMGDQPKVGLSAVKSTHMKMLEQVVGRGGSELLVWSYHRSFNGFVARLTDQESKTMAGMSTVVSVFPSRHKQLHTTRSWSFMGFPVNVTRNKYESNVIIGMLDTGIWPESQSFSDEGFSRPPSKWKGTCQSSSNFTCNNKLIGARYYNLEGSTVEDGGDSPRDLEGHGSHTSSTAAGSLVTGASLYGLGEGTARGAVPSARIAAYKICLPDIGCSDANILAAFDDAVADGVDIISISVGSPYPSDYFEDSIAIGAFHAMKNGILTSNSAGNTGPGLYSVANYSPWSLTVAASTIDRRFLADVKLGNGKSYQGPAVNTFDLKDTMYPLLYGGDAPNTSAGYDGSTSRYCYDGTLDEDLVRGKVVLCDLLTDASGPLNAGAVGTVMLNGGYDDYAFSYPLPATVLTPLDLGNVSAYINTTSNPTASILKSKGIYDPNAPSVVSFSSRGPNPITHDILKPDLTAPGVDILAAWSPVASMSVDPTDKRSVPYNIISGTSMSCPHATGAAAYVKSFHPTWSPAAIKSALMTTTYPMNVTLNKDAELGYGAGHINPIAAVDPGLIYDADEADYVAMLCGQGYSSKNLSLVTGDNATCSSTNNGTVWDLNYPSFALSAKVGENFSRSFSRIVTNVGLSSSTYKATVSTPSELNVSVEPNFISFKSQGEKQSFVVKISGQKTKSLLSASLVWHDGVHHVKSPIVVYA
ncbi:putative cucumisin [Dioscorea sansibarensis]